MTEVLNIHQRLAAAMRQVTYVQKERKQGMQYTIVSHDTVTAKVRPVLLENGIVYYPTRCEHSHNGNRAECSMTVRFINVDEPTDFFEVQSFGYGVHGQAKGPGKALSYAVQYALLKAMGLETGDDADHDSINHTQADPALEHQLKMQAEASCGNIAAIESMGDLQSYFVALPPEIKARADVIAAKDKRKAELTPQNKDAA